jgi:hypothetical protein
LTQSQQDNVLVILSEISNKDQYDSRKSRPSNVSECIICSSCK